MSEGIRKILSVGCGMRKAEPGVTRLDISYEVNPDVVWNMDQFPYPFEDSSYQEIECFDVIKHVSDIPKTMEEFGRLLEPKGKVTLTTPHFSASNSFTDPTHKHHLGYHSFDYFSDEHVLAYYSKIRFKVKYRFIRFEGGRLTQYTISRLANRWPRWYEKRLCWIFPAWFLWFELEVIK